MRYVIRRFTPSLDRRWLLVPVVAILAIAATTFLRWTTPPAELGVMVLGPDGQFHETLEVPSDWADTVTFTPDAVVRYPLILGIHNAGPGAARPGRLTLSVPLRYRLTGPGGEPLDGRIDPASPLITYALDPGIEAVHPNRLPTLLPAYETVWLETIVPRYYCMALAGAIPEFVPAPPPPLTAMSQVRVFYTLDGGDMEGRRTGILSLALDTTRMVVAMPEQPPTFPMETDPALARPDLGPLRYAGSRQVRCGEPESPMEMLSTVWETEGGARMITLDYGGEVRKHLYDLDGDGIIDRESWAPEGDGRFTATRRARLPTPAFLLPLPAAVTFDMARFDDIPPDSLAMLDPLRLAMPGPGPLPLASDSPAQRVAPPATAPGAPGAPAAPAAPTTAAPADTVAPRPPPARQQGPLGRPVQQPPPPDGRRR